MNMPAHSQVGFSSRKRWSACPGSVRLSRDVPPSSSKFADEGTAAHALQEHCLTKQRDATDLIGEEFVYDDHGELKAIVIESVMATHIQFVLNDIRAALVADPEAVLLVEERFHLHQLHPDLFGTGDVAIWYPRQRRLQVRDLKYGAGVAVDIEDEDGNANQQLEGYALGALLKYPQWKPVDVEMVIDQPRAPHADGFTRSTIRPVSYFVDMAADLVDEVRATEQASADYDKIGKTGTAEEWAALHIKQGDHCRWCPANRANFCPLKLKSAQEMAKRAFAPGLPYDAAELAKILDYLPVLEAWIKNTREFAYSEAEKGHAIPDYKLVEKRATRKWRDEAKAVMWLKQMGVQPYGEAPVITPAAAEKSLNKDQKAHMAALVVAESSGHTLVHSSDKREAVRLDAAAAFAPK